MSSREQIYVLETIKAMKKKIARDAIGETTQSRLVMMTTRYVKAYVASLVLTLLAPLVESDSDSEIQAPTNRGNKLKHKAKFVREGKLGPPTGPAVYKEARSPPSRRHSIHTP